MIEYNNESQLLILCQLTGSVLPRCLPVGIFTGGLGLALALLRKNRETTLFDNEDYIMATFAMQIMGVVIGYLLVMRTNMSLNRWMHAISQVEVMVAKWSDAYNALNSFFSGKEGTEEVLERILLFRIRVAHWFSLMSCLAFSTLTEGHEEDLGKVVIEPRYPEGSGRMPFSRRAKPTKIEARGTPWQVLHAPTEEEVEILEHCGDQVNMIALWIIQGIMLEVRAKTLDAPPPILTRVFQEISIGMLGFHQAHKVAMVPFPFPFAQMVSVLLVALCIFLPFYVDCFTKHVIITPVISFVVPVCYCGLNVLAVELELPFTQTKNAVDLEAFNEAFLGLLEDTLLQPQVPPTSEFARLEREIIQGVEFTSPPEENVPREGRAHSPTPTAPRTPRTTAIQGVSAEALDNRPIGSPPTSFRRPGGDGFTVKRVSASEPNLRETWVMR